MSDDSLTFEHYMPKSGDAVIMIRDNGRAAVGYVRHGDRVVKLPLKWSTHYAPEPEPALTPRYFNLTAGWNLKQWCEAVDEDEKAA